MRWRALVAMVLVAWLGGCARAMQPAVAVGGGSALVDRSPSWMAEGAPAAKSLLYVSDAGTFDVDVYTFPDLKPAGKLTGLSEPQGECSDSHGNVWIANTVSLQILEYAHGGKHAIRTLRDPTGYPGGCAVEAASGDVAVTNFFNGSGAGGVLIYRAGRGTPTPYFNPAVTYYYFDGYDAAGDLYVSGASGGGTYVLSVLPHGRHALTSLSVRGATIHFPGTVQWLGKTLVLGDQECDGKKSACFYEGSRSGMSVTITHKTALAGSCDVAQGWIQSGRIAGADYDDCGGGRSGAYLWKYPGGRAALRRVTGLVRPIGATISNR